MVDTSLSLTPEAPDAGTLSIKPQGISTPYTTDYATLKANRFNLLLGDQSPGTDTLRQSLLTGTAGQWDQALAAKSSLEDQQLRNNIVRTMMTTRDPANPPSMDEIGIVNDLTNNELHQPNVQTILSKKAAELYTNTLAQAPGNAVFNPSMAADRSSSLDTLDRGSVAAQRALIAQDTYAGFVKRHENDSLIDQGYAFLKTMIPGYTNLISRDAAGAPASPLLTGENWAEQYSYLYSLPPDQFNSKLHDAVAQIEEQNPQLARQFLQGALSFSSSDRVGGNLTDVADASVIAGEAGGLLRGGARVLKGERTIGAAGEDLGGAARAVPEPPSPGSPGGALPPAQGAPGATVGNRGVSQDLPVGTDGQFTGRDVTVVPGQTAQNVPPVSGLLPPPETTIPKPAPGFVRFYHGGEDPASGGGRWLTPDPTYARDFRTNGATTNNVSYVDIPENSPLLKKSFDDTGTDQKAPYISFEAPEEIAKQLKPFSKSNRTELDAAVEKSIPSSLNDPNAISRTAGENGLHELSTKADIAENIQTGDLMGTAKYEANPDPTAVEERLPSYMAPGRQYGEKSDMSSGGRNRGAEVISKVQDSGILNDILRVDRLNPEQLAAATNETYNQIRSQFPNVGHHVIDANTNLPEHDPYTNLTSVEVRFGDRNGQLFPTKQAAQQFMDTYIGPKFHDAEIKQNGYGGYYAAVTKHVSEVDGIRSMQIPTEYATPDSIGSHILGKLAGPDYVLEPHNVQARGRVVHSQEYMSKILQDSTDDIGQLSKADKRDLESVLRENRGNRQWYNSDNEFAGNFIRITGKVPTSQQTKAYRNYVDIYNLDYAIRDFDLVTQKARLGGESFRIKYTPKGKTNVTPYNFDGKQVQSIPWGSRDRFYVRIINPDGAEASVLSSRFASLPANRNAVQSALDQGASIILDPRTATYNVVRNFTRGKIQPGSLNYYPGGHVEYKYPYYIKQAKIESHGTLNQMDHSYLGDFSLANAPTAEHANSIAALLDYGRTLYRKGDPGLIQWWQSHLEGAFPLTEFRRLVNSGDIDLRVPIRATRAGQRTIDTGSWTRQFPDLNDVTKNEHNIFAQVQGKYIAERSAYDLDVLAAINGVAYNTGLEPLIDPLKVLESSMPNILDTHIVNDYRWKSASDWAQEFGHYYVNEGASINQVYANPWYYLKNGKLKPGLSYGQARAAENVRKSVLALNDYQSTTQSIIHAFSSSLADWAFHAGGDSARELMTNFALPAATNLDRFFKAAAYNAYLGFFNPKQFFVQSSEIMKIASISPQYAQQIFQLWYPFLDALRTDNIGIVKGLGSMMTKGSGMDHLEFAHMVTAMKQSGFSLVAHDQGYLGNVGMKWRGNLVSRALDVSTAPFVMGETAARVAAWITAWHEQRAIKGGTNFSRYGLTDILQRAKDLTNNMGRDSMSPWQRGIPGVFLQFNKYPVNYMAQVWGRLGGGAKLSTTQKFRMMMGMGILYGIPAALGGAALWPVGDSIRGWMMDNNYSKESMSDPAKVAMDGVIPYMLHAMIGEDFDIHGSYGPQGLPSLREIFYGDQAGMMKILAGAGLGVVSQTINRGWGALGNLYGDMLNSKNGSLVKLMLGDLVQPLRVISTVDSAYKIWLAGNTGLWLSKNNSTVAKDATMTEALLNAIGVTPQRFSDAYEQFQSGERLKAAQHSAQNEFSKLWAQSNRALNAGDVDGAMELSKRAKVLAVQNKLNYDAVSQAMIKGNIDAPMTDSAMQQYQTYWLKNTGTQFNDDGSPK